MTGSGNLTSRAADSIPLGRSAGGTAPVVCVETHGYDVEEEEQQKVNRSRSTGCRTGCQRHYSPSCLACQPGDFKSRSLTVLPKLVTVTANKCPHTNS